MNIEQQKILDLIDENNEQLLDKIQQLFKQDDHLKTHKIINNEAKYTLSEIPPSLDWCKIMWATPEILKEVVNSSSDAEEQNLEEKLIGVGFEHIKEKNMIGSIYYARNDVEIEIASCRYICIMIFGDESIIFWKACLKIPINSTFEQIMETIEKLKSIIKENK